MGCPLFAQSTGTSLEAETLEEVAVDGSVSEPLAPAIQNATMLIVLPVIVMVVGAVLFLAKRGPAGESTMGGVAKGGLYLMVIGFLAMLIQLIFLMVA